MTQLQRHSQFAGLGGKYPLLKYYSNILDWKMGDKTLNVFLMNLLSRVNAFAPTRNEERVRKLKR